MDLYRVTHAARRVRTSLLVSLSALAVLALAACTVTVPIGGLAADGTSQKGAALTTTARLQVVATTTQLADFAREVGGDLVSVTGMLPPGASAHHFDPSPRELLALARADVLIQNGVDLESFVNSAIEASGFSGELVTASDGVDLERAQEITAQGEHEAELGEASGDADNHAVDGHEATAHDNHDDHDHGDINPHLWTSPRIAGDMVAEITRGFAQADPDHAGAYRENATAYAERLTALDGWIAAQFDRVPGDARVLVTSHDSLRYYLHDYGIAYAGSLLPSFEDNAEPSAREIDQLIERIKQRRVRAIFVESSVSPKLAQTIAREAGVTVVAEQALYADALGGPGSGAETYIAATVHNTRTILEAWGVRPDPLPEELKQS